MPTEGHLRTARDARPFGLIRELRRAGRRRWLLRGDPRERFERIWRANRWHGDESRSGKGSSLAYTANLRARLPELIERFGVGSVFDAPCGDFHWMRTVVEAGSFRYVGGDIVPEIVADLARHANERVAFRVFDLTTDRFPRADLWLCRDCWFHLSYADVLASLEGFVASSIPYLLTTSHEADGSFRNRDVRSGGFRRIDLFAPPFGFPRETLFDVEDWIPPHPPRHMHLWERAQVLPVVQRLCRVLRG